MDLIANTEIGLDPSNSLIKRLRCISIIRLHAWGVACMDPKGTVGSIYKGEYYTLVHTTYESSGPYGFREEDFFFMFFQL